MMNLCESWPLDTAEHLAEALAEQGEAGADLEALVPALMQLRTWAAPEPSVEATRALMERLAPLAAARSPVRQALRVEPRHLGDLAAMLRLAHIQVTIFQPSFWLSSAAITLLGVLLVSGTNLSQALVLQLIAPLLSYLGAASAFRAADLGMLEFELACPPSPRQLMLARLVIVLGYDIALGLLASLLLWSLGGVGLLALILHWLAPLLLAFGLTLTLSLRMTVQRAATLIYVGWITIVIVLWRTSGDGENLALFASSTELLLGLAGCTLLTGAVIALPRTASGLLPHR